MFNEQGSLVWLVGCKSASVEGVTGLMIAFRSVRLVRHESYCKPHLADLCNLPANLQRTARLTIHVNYLSTDKIRPDQTFTTL